MSGQPLVGDKKSRILENVEKRLNFHEYRQDAEKCPHVAIDRLAKYATLTIKIVKARKLVGADPGWYRVWAEQKAVSDPYVNVYVDDCFLFKTSTVSKTCDPEWTDSKPQPLDIETAKSIVQLQVMDYDMTNSDDLLGFVEFPVGDMPIGKTIKGWFSLTSKTYLQGTASMRVEQAMKGRDLDGKSKPKGSRPHEGTSGEVYVEMTLDVVSKDQSDEFYSYCLPTPTWKKNPITGFKRKHEPLDAQGFYDGIMLLKDVVLDGFISPLKGFFSYIFCWREMWLSAVVTCAAAAAAWDFTLVGVIFFGLHGLFLLLLKSPERRAKMAADPATASLNDAGFQTIAWLRNSESMCVFLERVVAAMQGKVLDRKGLKEFAAFSFLEGVPVTTFEDLKKQLREAAEVKTKPCVSFPAKPLAKDTMVQHAKTDQIGQIQECVDSSKPPYAYKVAFGDGPTPEVQQVKGDELNIYLSLRWMSNKVVLAVIPDGFEDLITGLQPTIDTLGQQLQNVSDKVVPIITWEDPKSLPVAVGLFGVSAFLAVYRFLLGGIVDWFVGILLHLVLVLVVVGAHVAGAAFLTEYKTKALAKVEEKKHSVKDVSKWPFFKAA